MTIPSANGKIGTIGFCWGGGTSFLYALNQPALNAAVLVLRADAERSGRVCQRQGADPRSLRRERRARQRQHRVRPRPSWRKHNVTYDPHIFEGAGHGFLRQQGGNASATGNKKAAEEAWPLTLAFLRKHTS